MMKKREGRKNFEQREFRDKVNNDHVEMGTEFFTPFSLQGVTGLVWRADGLKKSGVDEEGNLQHPLPFDTEQGIMEPYERALQYKGENVVQVDFGKMNLF